jgi:hypothetical protein
MKSDVELRDWLPPAGRILGVASIVLGALVLTYFGMRGPSKTGAGSLECRMAYKRAKTALDTSMIDVRGASTGRVMRPYAETCGYERKLGLTK